MPTSLIAPLIGAGISMGAQSLFGKAAPVTPVPSTIPNITPATASSATFNPADPSSTTAPLSGFQMPGFSGGGLTSTFNNGTASVTPDAARLAAIGGLSSTFGNQADAIAALMGTVRPGFSDARTAALADVENARRNSIGNLQENLQRRRVLGSSFAQDAASRTEAEFSKQKADVEAKSYLAELDATQQLQQQKFMAQRQQFQTSLDEMNLEASVANGLGAKYSDILSKNAQMMAELTGNITTANLQGQTQTSLANLKAQTDTSLGNLNAQTQTAIGQGTNSKDLTTIQALADQHLGQFVGGISGPFGAGIGTAASKYFTGSGTSAANGGPTGLAVANGGFNAIDASAT